MGIIGVSDLKYKDAAVFHMVEPLSSKDLNRIYGIRRVSHGKVARASLKRLQALRHEVLTLGKKSFKAINKVASRSRAREASESKIQDSSTKREWIRDGKQMRRQFRQDSKGVQRERVGQVHAAARKFVASALLQRLASEGHGTALRFLEDKGHGSAMSIENRELEQYKSYAHAKGEELLALFKQDVMDALSQDLKEVSTNAALTGKERRAPLVLAMLSLQSTGPAGVEGKKFESVIYDVALAMTKTPAMASYVEACLSDVANASHESSAVTAL